MKTTRVQHRRPNKLFCAGSGIDTLFILAPTLYDALLLTTDARQATDTDVALFADHQDIGRGSTREAAKRLGVSRQTISNWRVRARVKIEAEKITDKLSKIQNITIEQVRQLAEQFSLSVVTVERYCRRDGVRIIRPSRRTPDEELIRIATGRTWVEFAAAAGKAVTTLRTYIYARPQLARAVRAVMVLKTPGKKQC